MCFGLKGTRDLGIIKVEYEASYDFEVNQA
jgi:hypothetical protein